MENKEIDKKKSKFGIVILIIFLIILLFGGGYFIYKQIYIEDSSNNENNNNDNSNNSSEVIDTSNYKYSMKAYKTDTNDNTNGFLRYLQHFGNSGDERVAVCNLTKNYRGWISSFADELE